ncbi:PepSY domain-containing protein [Streptomyces sp. MB09-01]|uniref:PepSY domain-containing protein n=1 Tax=Streptomyces sp. MB09-01 TaxID=3028666 RepID=UPI0029A4E1BC|nr:PepSY domain-containing protein [Streptomyces sp. MB09-01]MDX3537990.1 PepSY domain-containing protein [Streptomyces sp. MB09-01]
MKRNAYVSAAASVVLCVGGPAAAATAASADTARTVTAAAAAVPTAETAEEASAAALKHYPGVVESLDKDGTVWNVDVISKDGKGHAELEVAADGTVTELNRDTDENATEHKDLLAAEVNAEQAMKAALAAHPGQVWSVSWQDDEDGGAHSWDVEVRSSDGKIWNARVDHATGKVTPSGSDSDDGDDN